MPTYQEYIPWLDAELAQLGRTPVLLLPAMVVEALRNTHNPAADEACRVFSLTHEWPPLGAALQLACWIRLHFARWYFADMGDAPLDGDLRSLLDLLLTGVTHDAARDEWLTESFG